MDYQIRKIKENEYPILPDFLHEAIFIPDGMEKPSKSIIEHVLKCLGQESMEDIGYGKANIDNLFIGVI